MCLQPPQCNGGQSRLPRSVKFLSPKWRRSVGNFQQQQRPNIDVVSAKILVLDRDEKFNKQPKLQPDDDQSNESDRLSNKTNVEELLKSVYASLSFLKMFMRPF